MAKSKNYGRMHRPEYYFEGQDLRIAQSIYNGERYLLENLSKDEINKISSKGMSLFLYTIYADNEEAMNILLKKGGDVNMFTEVESFDSDLWHKSTPISYAAELPKISYIKTLLSYNANINDNRATPALINAVHRNDREMVDYLLDHGADIHVQHAVTMENALIRAIDIHDLDMVNHLLDRGADPMQRGATGDCLAYSVQHQIKRNRGTDKYKKILQELKKRLESMGVVFPVQKIPPSKEESAAIRKVEKPSTSVGQVDKRQEQVPPTKPPHSWILDDDDDNWIIS